MKLVRVGLAILAGLLFGFQDNTIARAQQSQSDAQSQVENLNWQTGPRPFDVAGVVTIALPPSVKALGPTDSSKFIKLNGNPPESGSYVVSASD
jgi:hypothetical protein